MSVGFLARVCLLVSIGCGSTRVDTIPTQRYYAYTVAGESSLDREPPPNAPGKALSAIKKLRRVAFVPPDTCLDMRAAETSTTVDKRVLRMECGVTMSEMEREAEKVGFDVVTWQSLKGEARPLEQAKQLKIELLFEVNELDVIAESNRSSSVEFSYFSGEGSGPVQPLQVTESDNEACKAYHARAAPGVSGMTSVLDLKMVQVSTGSVLWSYRHVENATAAAASSLIRFPINARQEMRTSKPWWPWLVFGGGLALIAAIPDDPRPGAAIAAGGLGAAIFWPRSTKPVGDRVYEPVSAVLCRRPHIQDTPVPVGPAQPVVSNTFRSQSKINTNDVTEERRRMLIKKSVRIFMKQLTVEE
ncbi:MAG: hypothetical protein H0T42_32155 [Deltaproteobacteria bacterium]|nr:hypothetical protein [Deltaproteobacteria bacterium]